MKTIDINIDTKPIIKNVVLKLSKKYNIEPNVLLESIRKEHPKFGKDISFEE
jgi:hypothetical protein